MFRDKEFGNGGEGCGLSRFNAQKVTATTAVASQGFLPFLFLLLLLF